MRYVALLRGVNVGGNNKVPMAELREVAADLGWTDAVTYIASGNLVFDAPRASTAKLAERLEQAISERFGITCRVLVLGAAAVRRIAAAIPDGWGNDTERKADVVYLLDGVDPAEVVTALRPRDGIDHPVAVPGAVIWMVERKDVNRSGLQRLVGGPHYARATIRNANTARKLAALVTP